MLKRIVVFVAALAITACSSAPKKTFVDLAMQDCNQIFGITGQPSGSDREAYRECVFARTSDLTAAHEARKDRIRGAILGSGILLNNQQPAYQVPFYPVSGSRNSVNCTTWPGNPATTTCR